MRFLVLFAALPMLASAWSEHTFFARQTGNATECESSDKVCGPFCIPSDYTCCPDLAGGCPADAVCQIGTNDVYGCCPEGETCTGAGGAEFLDDESTSNGTSTSGDSGSSTGTSNAGASSATGGAQSLAVGYGSTLAIVAAGVVALL
jgi:hypothetical protein